MPKNLITFLLILIQIFNIYAENALTFEKMLEEVKKIGKLKRIAVAGGDNLSMLQCCRHAKDLKIADSILIGDSKKTKELAEENGIDISDFELIDVKEDALIGLRAANLVRDGKADIYAKGSLETSFNLKAVFDKKYGLRKSRHISGLTLFEIPNYNKFLIFTDSHVMPYPSLNEKVSLVNNAVEFAHSIGIAVPKVAAITANSRVNPKIPETVDAQRLKKMNEIGQIKGCIVDGPLSFDLAANPVIPKYKSDTRKINGDADIVVFPNIHSANIAYNLMLHGIEAKSATLLTGTTAPVVFTARGGTWEAKFNSVVVAIFYSEYLQKNS